MKSGKNGSFKLTIELVPETCFYSNVRKIVSTSRWDEIRKKAYQKADYNCSICGAEDVRLSCHEIWSYNDENYVQHFKGYQALCESCHMIKHAGFSMYMRKGREKYDQDKLIEHFCKVNNCSKEDFLEHREKAFDIWRERSKHEWSQPWIERVKGDEKVESNTPDEF